MDQLHKAPPPSRLFKVTMSKHRAEDKRKNVLVTHKAPSIEHMPRTPMSLMRTSHLHQRDYYTGTKPCTLQTSSTQP